MMTVLARQKLSRTEQAGLLAGAALAVAAERMGGRPPEPFLKDEEALQAELIGEIRRCLKIAPDDVSDEALRAIEDELDAEMEAVADPVDVDAALARVGEKTWARSLSVERSAYRRANTALRAGLWFLAILVLLVALWVAFSPLTAIVAMCFLLVCHYLAGQLAFGEYGEEHKL